MLFITFQVIFGEKPAEFFLKSDSSMVFLLISNVFANIIQLG